MKKLFFVVLILVSLFATNIHADTGFYGGAGGQGVGTGSGSGGGG
jgi:hypothetical protein